MHGMDVFMLKNCTTSALNTRKHPECHRFRALDLGPLNFFKRYGLGVCRIRPQGTAELMERLRFTFTPNRNVILYHMTKFSP